MDPERAQREDELEKMRNEKATIKEQNAAAALVTGGDGQQPAKQSGPSAAADLESEDLCKDDDVSSMQAPMAGKLNYDQMIKSMIARLEFNNSLAPIQDYGRHQTKQAHKKKKINKKKPVGTIEDAGSSGI